MKTERLDYPLPPELIAQAPAQRRRDARLMLVTRGTGAIAHLLIPDLEHLLTPGDLLVVNDTRVIRGRLRAKKETGASVEVFLLSRQGPPGGREETWDALARPGKRLREGMTFRVKEELGVTLLRRQDAGRWDVRLFAEQPLEEVLERVGDVPLPPYIRRGPGDLRLAADADRYQTVYAARPGSVAAPTAGLHFDRDLLAGFRRAGIAMTAVTLSVGYGTFSPIRTKDLESYAIHPEEFRLGEETASAVAACRERGGRVIAVGTTSVRVLETCATADGRVRPAEGTTRLFLHPGRRFRVADALLTNFHLPRSSLLALVMAFAGEDLIREAYRIAVAERYRFFSYGDAMFIR